MTLSCTPLTHHLLHVQCPPSPPPPPPPPHTPATSATTHLPTVKPARTQFSSLEPAAITASAAADDDAVAGTSCCCRCCCRYHVSLPDSSLYHHHHNHQQLIPLPHRQQYNNCQHHHRQQEQRHRQQQQNDQVLHEQYLHQRHQSSRKDNQCRRCEHYRNSRNCSSSNDIRHWDRSGGVESSCSNGPFSTAAAAAAAVVTSKTLRWCRTLLIFPALSLLLLLRLRRKSRRHRTSQVPHVLLSVSLLLTMLTGRCLASPWIEESPNSVKLRAQFCQPVPEQHLRGMLGTAFDSSRMTNQDPRTGKRGDPGLDPALEEAALDSYYMEDDPRTGGYVDEDFVDIVTDEGGEGEEWFRREEVEVTEGEGGEIEVEEKDFEEEEGGGEAGYYRKKDSGASPLSRRRPEPRERRPERGQMYPYMKRRKRRSTGRRDRDRERGFFYPDSGAAATPTTTTTRTSRRAEGGSYSSSPSSSSSSSEAPNKDKKSRDSLLPLRLLLSGKNRKLRRKLKKVFRKKARKLSKKPPPWTCDMAKRWLRLKDGYFPRYMLDGRCMTDKCFYRLYSCVPQKYRVKVLKRDPDYCNPLPTLGLNSTYEQKWSVVRYYTTVGCNCQAKESDSSSSSSSSSSSRTRKP